MRIAMLAAIGLAVSAASADAAMFTVTYTGKVTFGQDDGNYFGLGRELTTLTPDATVALRFVIDPGRPGSSQRDSPGSEQLDGSGAASNPFVQSSFTLNGRTIAWSNSPGDGYDLSYGFAERSDSTGYDDLFHSSIDYVRNAQSYDTGGATVISELHDFVHAISISVPLDYDVQAGDYANGSFGSFRYDEATGQYGRSIGINFDVTHVSVVSAVPEPSSWATLVAGFGLIGGAFRRRRAPTRDSLATHNHLGAKGVL